MESVNFFKALSTFRLLLSHNCRGYNREFMASKNPCVECGACCAFFRVSFFWEEISKESPGSVPAEMTEPLDELLQCMKGTDQPHPRCICLLGKVGQQVGCAIYARRSTTCRDFGLHAQNGTIAATADDLTRCNEARKAWGLPPLTQPQLRNSKHSQAIRHHPAIQHRVHRFHPG